MPTFRSLAVLVLATILIQGSGWASNDAPQDQLQSSHVALIRVYALRDFHQSLMDRLSGGIAQNAAYRMVSDSKGRILMTDPALSVIHVFDVEHGIHSQIGGDFQHRLSRPGYITVDADDNVYVTDPEVHAILVFHRNGRFLRTIGAGILRLPTGVTVDKQSRKLYVADWWSGMVLTFDLEGNLLQAIGSQGFGAGQLYGPTDIVLHHGSLVVLDALNQRFDVFDLQGSFLGALSFGPDRTPAAFTFDGHGNLFYVDLDSGALVATDPHGRVLPKADQVAAFEPGAPSLFAVGVTCVATDVVGGILAASPTFDIETLAVEADKQQNSTP